LRSESIERTLVEEPPKSGGTRPSIATPGMSEPVYPPAVSVRPTHPLPRFAGSPSGFAVCQMVRDSSCERLYAG
jgi:hypothetical protein